MATACKIIAYHFDVHSENSKILTLKIHQTSKLNSDIISKCLSREARVN